MTLVISLVTGIAVVPALAASQTAAAVVYAALLGILMPLLFSVALVGYLDVSELRGPLARAPEE